MTAKNLQKLDAYTCVAPSLFKRLKFESEMRIIQYSDNIRALQATPNGGKTWFWQAFLIVHQLYYSGPVV